MTNLRPDCLAAVSPPQAETLRSNFEENRRKALALFAARGFSRVSMRELAAHLGIAAGSIYHHYRSKEALLFDLIEELYEDLLEIFASLPKQQTSKEERLRLIIHAHIRLHQEKPLTFRLAARDMHCLSEINRIRITKLHKLYINNLFKLLEKTCPPHRSATLRATSRALAALLNYLPGWLRDSSLPESERNILIESMILGALSHHYLNAT